MINVLQQLRRLLSTKIGGMFKWMRILDTNRDNIIDKSEFRRFLDMYHMAVEDSVVQRLWDLFDADQDGKITVSELCDAIERCEDLWREIKYDSPYSKFPNIVRKAISKRRSSVDYYGGTPGVQLADSVERKYVKDVLEKKYNINENVSNALSQIYFEKGTFSMDDLTKALESVQGDSR
mmetsp:Transcript_17600/g.31584  ORF Transcript_17600/g.31584 Transcript_17600/m.31584 type:complete len:179 (-) Transcript_17600:122-658(-)